MATILNHKSHIEEVDKDEFDNVISENRHNELLNAVKGASDCISKSISQDKNKNSLAIASALNNHTTSIEKFADAVKQIQFPEPKVNVQTNHKPIQDAIGVMASNILQSHSELKKSINDLLEEHRKPKEWEHTIKKINTNGDFKITSKQIK